MPMCLAHFIAALAAGCTSPAEPSEDEFFIVNGSSAVAAVGDSIALQAAIRDPLPRLILDHVKWTSSDTSVALVDDRGIVRTVSDGSAVITASYLSRRASTTVSTTTDGEGATTTPPSSGGRMIQGPWPAVGWGANVLRGCAPLNGGDWEVAIVPVTQDQTLRDVLPSLPEGPDLVVVTFETGGKFPGAALRGATRQSCIYIAGQTAAETYWATNLIINGRNSKPTHDIAVEGLGFVDSSVGGFSVTCATQVHASHLTVALAVEDLASVTSDECGDHVTLARSVVGPSGAGYGGKGGGFFDGLQNTAECSKLSYVNVALIEPTRRGPLMECGGNITNTVVFNSTDAGRIQKAGLQINIRSVLVKGGPITGCDLDRAISFFDQALDPNARMEIYLDQIRSEPARGCSWQPVESTWTGEHTVFHYAVRQTPVPFEGHGVLQPHEDPEWPAIPLPLSTLESEVLSSVGANFRLRCDGAWERRVNGLDAVNLQRMRDGDYATAPWESRAHWEAENGPLRFPRGSPCPDINANHIPDQVEQQWGHSDPGRLMSDGRPAVLHWLEGSTGR